MDAETVTLIVTRHGLVTCVDTLQSPTSECISHWPAAASNPSSMVDHRRGNGLHELVYWPLNNLECIPPFRSLLSSTFSWRSVVIPRPHGTLRSLQLSCGARASAPTYVQLRIVCTGESGRSCWFVGGAQTPCSGHTPTPSDDL